MKITVQSLSKMAGRAINDNMRSVIIGLEMAGVGAGLQKPHRLAMYLGQSSHETLAWYHDREVWGPTKAQKNYEGRKDLGNIYAGDGSKFKGRGGFQLTGRDNYTRFGLWAKTMVPSAPDFTKNPDAVNTDPWEGLSSIWFWSVGNKTRRSLNAYADEGDFQSVTKKINGGLNGFADRKVRYGRVALVLLGRDPENLFSYQREKGLVADGICGTNTVARLHADLLKLPPVTFGEGVKESKPIPDMYDVQSDADPKIIKTTNPIAAFLSWLSSIFGGSK